MSPQIERLKIISENEFKQAQYILEQRALKNDEKRQIAMNTKGKAMLSGNIYCGHCGGRITTIRYKDSYVRKDGTKYEVDQESIAVIIKTESFATVMGK